MSYKVLVGKEVKGKVLIPGDIVNCDEITAQSLIKEGVIELYNKDIEQEKKAINEKLVEQKQIKEKEIKNMTIEVKAENKAPMGIVKFMSLVRDAGLGDSKAKEILDLEQKTIAGQNETTNADGGYLLQAEVAKAVANYSNAQSVIAPKCAKFKLAPTSKSISIPSVYDTAHSNTAFAGGIRLYKVAEGIDKTPFKQAISTVTITVSKLVGLAYMTDELKMDCPFYEYNLIQNVGEAFAEKIDNEILNGSDSICTATINHASVVDFTIAGIHPTAAELAGMYSRAFNPSRCEWFMNCDQYAEVIALGSATAGFPVFQPNFAASPNGLLLGRPINIIDYCAASNTQGDILFADFSQYALVERGSAQFDTSIHVLWVSDQTSYRFVRRIGGAPMPQSTVTYPSTYIKGWAVERA